MRIERVEYLGWPDCLHVSNGTIELYVTTVVGPRVIHCGFVDGTNMFGVMEDTKGLTGGDEWHIFGGHRLWHSPEADPRSYSPDNSPIEVSEEGGAIELKQPVEEETGIEKRMAIAMSATDHRVDVTHRLYNRNLWPVRLAPWALTVMDKGGEAILPQPQGDFESLLPNRRLTLWPYTDTSDERLRWGERYIRMRQDAGIERRCKLGLSAEDGWVGYVNKGQLFVKRFGYVGGAEYPDWGAAVELFTDDRILEVETLGPLTQLAPGGHVEHEERWYLFDDVQVDDSEGSIDDAILPLTQETE